MLENLFSNYMYFIKSLPIEAVKVGAKILGQSAFWLIKYSIYTFTSFLLFPLRLMKVLDAFLSHNKLNNRSLEAPYRWIVCNYS